MTYNTSVTESLMYSSIVPVAWHIPFKHTVLVTVHGISHSACDSRVEG